MGGYSERSHRKNFSKHSASEQGTVEGDISQVDLVLFYFFEKNQKNEGSGNFSVTKVELIG